MLETCLTVKTWQRETYYVQQDTSNCFHIFNEYTAELIDIIVPDHETVETILNDLNSGESVEGWEDGAGGIITVPEVEEGAEIA